MARFAEIFPEKGFDPDGGPYQMVPGGGGVRYLKLIDGDAMTIKVDSPEVCDVVETDSLFRFAVPDSGPPNSSRPSKNVSQGSDRFFKLIGGSPGRCRVTAVKSYQSHDAHLSIAVKRRKPRTVAFTICSDGAGHEATINNEAEVNRYFQFAKNLWLDQANVEFQSRGVQRQSVPQDLGDTIWVDPKGTPSADAIFDLAVDGVDLNVFFVWHVQVVDGPDNLEGITSESGEATIIGARRAAYFANTLAHEFGHHLGISGHDVHLPVHLMYENSRGAAKLLTSIDIDTVNG